MVHQPKNVLVTGGCGFIGSNFINHMFYVWNDVNFVNYDKLILNSDAYYIKEEIVQSRRYKLITADIRNRQIMANVLQENDTDTIVHFAADCTSTRCYGDTIESLENNVISFIEFLETVREFGRVKRFIHVSTDEVYGDSDLRPDEEGKTEDTVLLPGNPYAATKAACEAYVHMYRSTFDMPIIILRINNIYGPNQWDVKVIPRFIEFAERREKFAIQGTGKQLRSWLFVDDAAEGIRAVAERGKIGDTYNLGTYFEMNILDLAHKIQAEVDKQLGRDPTPVEFITIPDRPYNDLRYLLDISKVYKELSWSPKIPFDEGIRRVVKSALEPQKRSKKMRVVIYGGDGWIGQQVQKMLRARDVEFEVAQCRIGRQSDQEVEDELNRLCGTHVFCCTGRTHGGACNTIEYLEGGPDKVQVNIRDNLYCPMVLAHLCRKLGLHFTYVGTAYLFSYDREHTIGGKGFLDNDLPTFFGNSYSVVKGFTDRMMQQFNGGIKENLTARITLPLNFALNEERNLLTKLLKYQHILDIPVSITILDDCLPALFKLMEKRIGGHINLVNPGPISLHQILQLYKELVDPHLHDYSIIDSTTEKGKQLIATKGNCALDTTLLHELSPSVPSAIVSLQNGFRRIAQKT
ncbi:unnamed protein product [Enterobius vermicularis]|uniref:dTDP-D-glucose 4,6-dehydratase n=1 Tax=Enterobius vermicularis TaxID=51028 RepID=A0A0N4UXX6_ENTVE|nr:unnamed protein product [Enterobius vermicularis]